MKTIGLIGGMSWESTVTYYQVINETVREKLGGLHSAKILMSSIDFAPLAEYQEAGDWESAGKLMAETALQLEKGGADFIVIGANTMHKSVPDIKSACALPLLHIAEATACELKKDNIRNVGLLGTRYTMCQDFYKGKLREEGLSVLIPEEDIGLVNDIIYDELCLGILKEDSKQALLTVIEKLKETGAEGVILGCTELGLLIKDGDTDLPLYDTTLIHARAAALKAMEDELS